MTSKPAPSGAGRHAAYAALALALLGLPLVAISESGCEFVGETTQDYSGRLTEPGATGGVVAFALAPLIAIVAVVLLARAGDGQPGRRLAFAAAFLVFPVAALTFSFWVVKSAFGCGFF